MTRVGCHESVHVCPYFQRVGVQYGCQYGCRIVRSSPAEISHIAVGRVRTYESGHDGYVRQFSEFLEHELLRLCEIHYMLVEIWLGLDELAGIVQDRTAYGPVHDDGRQPFPVADYGIGSLGRQVFDQENAFEDVRQFAEHGCQPGFYFRKHFRDDCVFSLSEMAFRDGCQLFFVRRVAFRSCPGCLYKLVCDAPEGGDYHDDVIIA